LILSCLLPALIFVFGIGGALVAKYAERVVAEFAAAATVAEEVISSVQTTQAFGMEEKLSSQYDVGLRNAQRIGYRRVVSSCIMFASVFLVVYMTFGLAFCLFSWISSPDLKGKDHGWSLPGVSTLVCL